MSKMVSEIPKLVDIWAEDLNPVPATDMSAGTNTKVWWRCKEKGHLYQRGPYQENICQSCPICKKESVVRVADRPDLMGKWATEENAAAGMYANIVTITSRIKTWWRCKAEKHLYQRSPLDEVHNRTGCPICSVTTVSDKPDLLEKWATSENAQIGLFADKVSAMSNKKAWWSCKAKRHLYQRSVNDENKRGFLCPICKSDAQKYLSDYPELLSEFAYDLNSCSPETITAGSDVPVFWRCKDCGYVWKAQPYHRISGHTGCRLCRGHFFIKGHNDIASLNPPNFRYWDYERNAANGIHPENFSSKSHQPAWWTCKNGHHEEVTIANYLNRDFPCKECRRIALENHRKDSALVKKLAKEKEPKQKVVIKKERRVTPRKIKKPLPDTLLCFWDADDNLQRGFFSDSVNYARVYSWKSDCGHSWRSDLRKMILFPECPICKTKRNSIAAIFPYLIDVYDVEKNDGVPPDMAEAKETKYYWWTCRKGHSFVATLGSVASHKETGCMFCDKEKSFYSI
ncbi:zinc-ribbon domain-containing protein [Oscillibacter sp.]|uniref:zinc-ribbon domain-containing protein n=1 Tax=Oscillibacter sp. TaxID=1945593 RepID=UPI003391DD18